MKKGNQKEVLYLGNKYFFPLVIMVLLVSTLFTISADSVYHDPSVYGHTGNEVSGAWGVNPESDGRVSYYHSYSSVGGGETDARVSIGTVSYQSQLNLEDGFEIAGSGKGIIFPDGTRQTIAYPGKNYCPPRVIGLNVGDPDENFFYEDCYNVGPNVVKITNPVACENGKNDCYPFWASTGYDPLCKFLGYKGVNTDASVGEVTQETAIGRGGSWTVFTVYDIAQYGVIGGQALTPGKDGQSQTGKALKNLVCVIE